MMKKVWTQFVVDYFEINTVDMKYPTESEANNMKIINDFTANISLSKNQMLGNLFAALVIKQNPTEQIKVPAKKK